MNYMLLALGICCYGYLSYICSNYLTATYMNFCIVFSTLFLSSTILPLWLLGYLVL
jgi:hypothetical protein